MSVTETFLTLLGGDAPAPELTGAIIAQADALLLGYLCRDSLPEGLDAARAHMAVSLYRRMGAEGESSRAEGDVRSVYEVMPETVRMALRPFRRARAASIGE